VQVSSIEQGWIVCVVAAITLKAFGFLSLPWVVVLAPVWGPFLIFLIALVLFCLAAIAASLLVFFGGMAE
jgi:hypothetical protein